MYFKILQNIIFLIGTAFCSYFADLSNANVNIKDVCTENTPCIKEMNITITESIYHLELLKKENLLSNLEDNILYSTRKEILNEIIQKIFLNGINFPISYNSELEGYKDDYVKKLLKDFRSIKFNSMLKKMRLSALGKELRSNFNSLKDTSRDIIKYYLTLQCLIEFIHEKLLEFRQNNLTLLDGDSWSKIRQLKLEHEKLNESLDTFDKSLKSVLESLINLAEEWKKLSNEEKYYVIYGYEHPSSEVQRKEYILPYCTRTNEELVNNKKNILDKLNGIGREVDLKLACDDIKFCLNFFYDYELFIEKARKFSYFLNEKESLLEQKHYLDTKTNRSQDIENFRIDVKIILKEFEENKKYSKLFENMYEQLLLKGWSISPIIYEYIERKYEKSNKHARCLLLWLFTSLSKKFEMEENEIKDYINQFKRNNFDLKRFSEADLKYLSDFLYFCHFDILVQISALNNIRNKLSKYLSHLRYSKTENLEEESYLYFEKVFEKLDDFKINSQEKLFVFEYPADQNSD